MPKPSQNSPESKASPPGQLPGASHAKNEDLSDRQQAASQWLINEFNALRQEFIERFRTENLLVLGALTFLGTILSIAFKDPNPNLHILR